jgi:polysaccharide export outer membrane protein
LVLSPARAAGTNEVPEYRLGGGDLIKILVYQNPDLTLETRLSDSGSASYPLLGSIKLGGLTVAEAERLIANGLRKGEFVKDPQVTVVLETARGSQVSVLGQVQKPGRYVLETGQTHLSDVLAMAGGVTPQLGADQVTVVGSRDGKPFRKVDLPRCSAVRSVRTICSCRATTWSTWTGRRCSTSTVRCRSPGS